MNCFSYTHIMLLLILSLGVPLFLNADWQTPLNMGPVINGSQEDYSPFIIREGTSLYYARGPVNNRDLYMSVFLNGQWQTPHSMGSNINSSYDDRDPTVIGDTMVIFASDRPSPYTGWPFHLWYSRMSPTGFWEPARIAEEPVSSNSGEETPWMMWEGPDTLLLFFSSYSRPGGLGSWDIWQARKINDIWQTPTNIGSPVNTSGLESSPNIWVSYFDGLDSIRMYYVTNFGGYFADRVDGVWRNPVRLTDIINSGGIDRPSISFDNHTLYFSSWRTGGYGQRDLWYSTYSSGVENEEKRPSLSPGFHLTALPNPFRIGATITLSLDREEVVDLAVYALDGRRIRSLLQGRCSPGERRVNWDGRDGRGLSVGPGAYFLRLRVGGGSLTNRLLKLK
jgi:hypothetical protein